MLRVIIGFSIAFLAFVVAFAMSAGGGQSLGEMLHQLNFGAIGGMIFIDSLIMIVGMLVGGLIISFEPRDLKAMIFDCCTKGGQIENEGKLRVHILVCQAGAKLSILAGMINAIIGVIVVMMYKIGGDTAIVGRGIAVALCGAMTGILLAGLFTAMKYRFLRQHNIPRAQ